MYKFNKKNKINLIIFLNNFFFTQKRLKYNKYIFFILNYIKKKKNLKIKKKMKYLFFNYKYVFYYFNFFNNLISFFYVVK